MYKFLKTQKINNKLINIWSFVMTCIMEVKNDIRSVTAKS